MNVSLIGMGCPANCVELVAESIQIARDNEEARSITGVMKALLEKPDAYVDDRYFGKLAHAVLKERHMILYRLLDRFSEEEITEMLNAANISPAKTKSMKLTQLIIQIMK